MDRQAMRPRQVARGDEAQTRAQPGAQLSGPRQAGLERLAQGLNAAPARLQAPNRTGMPLQLKAAVEALSGVSLDGVRVRYNSAQPARLGALAYTRGSEIHLGPGQARHLPHEAWHAAQQAQGRVKPTVQMKSGIGVNADAALEREADVMGARAAAAAAGGVVAQASAARGRAGAASGGVVQCVGGQKFGLEVTGDQAQPIIAEGLAALKVVQAAYKATTKATKDAAIATFKGGAMDDAGRQAVYTAALQAAEMTPAGLAGLWVAKGGDHTYAADVFSYKGQAVATVREGAAAYVQSAAAAGAGLSAVFKRHTLDGPSDKEYVELGGRKVRRYAYRGITPPERLAYKQGQVLTPGNFGATTGQMGHKFDDATGVASDRVRDQAAGKVTDLEWLNSHAHTHLAATPNTPMLLSFLQVRKAANKAFSARSTAKDITSNHGASFGGFGEIKIDLARVPTANVLHHYKAPAFDAATINAGLGRHGAPSGPLRWETDRANETVTRNREIVLSQIPHAAVASLTDSQPRTLYEAAFRAKYTPVYRAAYRSALDAAGLNDAAPTPAVFPWSEDHFGSEQGESDFDRDEATDTAKEDAKPRIGFAVKYRLAYPKGWAHGYEDAAWSSAYITRNPSTDQINVPEAPPTPPVPAGVGEALGQTNGFNAGAAAGTAAGANYAG